MSAVHYDQARQEGGVSYPGLRNVWGPCRHSKI